MKKLRFLHVFSLLVFSIFVLSCSSDDESQIETEQFLVANVNGMDFTSDETKQQLGFSRMLMPSGGINLHARTLSSDEDVIEILLENFKGPGKYYFGDSFYNKSWLKFERPSRSESWGVDPGKALNLNSNFIEITRIGDGFLEGKIYCNKLMNRVDGLYGAMEGEFRLVYRD